MGYKALRGLVIIALLATAKASSFSYPPSVNLSKSYAPVYIECPDCVKWVRPASEGLNPQEAEWVHCRKRAILPDFKAYLDRACLQDFDIAKYMCALEASDCSSVPTLGLAISGGGFASAFTGTGALRALDSRVPGANEAGTGGFLQSITYFSGLSGGSWPVMSFTANNFPTADDLLDNLWKPQYNREASTVNASYAETPQATFSDIGAKFKAGFNVSVADYLGRGLGFEFLYGPNGGLNVTMASIRNVEKFKTHAMPLPLVQINEVVDGDQEYFGVQVPDFANTTLYEFSPFEFGSWRGSAQAFTPVEYLGTRLDKGVPLNMSQCVVGFDRGSFIMGTSGDGFNFYYIENRSNGTLAPFGKRSMNNFKTSAFSPGSIAARGLSKRQSSSGSGSGTGNTNAFSPELIELFLRVFNASFHLNVTQISYAGCPNPFLGLETSSPAIRSKEYLRLEDGSEYGSVLSVFPQTVPERKVDFILSWENSGDAGLYGWNNGSNVYNAYLQAKNSDIPFPIVPTATTFVERNYTYKPVFFGCDAKLTTTNSTESPIIAYFANAPYSTYANISYTDSALSRAKVEDLWINNFNQISQGNGTIDSEWPSCLACAAIDRSLAKVGMKRTKQCQQCFDRYCWDGTSEPDYQGPGSLLVDLHPLLEPNLSYAEWNRTVAPALQLPPN